jgi:tetratricopeptide (TPR) repeat protein
VIRRLVLVLLAASVLACTQQAGPRKDPELDALFERLSAAPDAASARPIEERIWSRWRQSGSPTIDILLERAASAQGAGDPQLAVEFLDQAGELAPNYAEPWSRRAALAIDAHDYAGAIAAIQETLRREPRHFGALTWLGLIYEDLGRQKEALEAYREALKVHPFFEDARKGAARLEPRVDGAEA